MQETKRQISRFVVVGIICVSVDLTFYSLLALLALWPLDAAKGVGYLAGVAIGFVLNKLWTFRSSRRSLSEPALYLALYLVTLAVNVGCNHLVLWTLGSAHSALAFVFATGVSTVLNFLGLKLVTFRRGVAERREGVVQAKRKAA